MSDKRMSAATRAVLHRLLSNPTREYYGPELSKTSGIPHATMYGILARLEASGWLANRLEHTTERATPPRRYYRLTEHGAREAPAAVARANARAAQAVGTDRAGLKPDERAPREATRRPA